VRTKGTPAVVVSLQREEGISLGSSRVDVDSILQLAPGQIAGLSGLPGSGLTRVGLSLIAPYASAGSVAYLDVRGWMNPAAAWELGIAPCRLVVVRNGDVVTWGKVLATLLSGVKGVYAEVPNGVREAVIRNLAAKARAKRTPLVLRPLSGVVPSGIAHLRLEARNVSWEGTDAGHGQLIRRRTVFEASGKSARGIQRTIEIEDDGTNDLRVVPDLGIAATRRLA
jgi:hypothetical protein